jgi:hypothetical protein
LLLAPRRGLTRHRVLQCHGDRHITDLDRADGHTLLDGLAANFFAQLLVGSPAVGQ